MNLKLACVATVVFSLSDLCPVEVSADYLIEQPTATIAGREGESFPSLQQAIDAASAGDTIRLGAGRFNERVTIAKPVTLVGADAGKTLLGPTEQEQRERWDLGIKLFGEIGDIMQAAEQAKPRRSLTEDENKQVAAKYAEIERLSKRCLQPVVQLENTELVVLRNLHVTMPLTPREGRGLQVTSAVNVNNSQARLEKCAIVGCLSAGVQAEGSSRLEIVDSLVTACWGTGVTSNDAQAEVRIVNSDIRNNYHYNIRLRSDECEIEGCRISGTAWSGLTCGGAAPRIERNVIFNNSRGIYSAGMNGMVRHNLFYRNHVGASCWSSDQPLYESNVFLDNSAVAMSISGPAEPKIRSNLIVSSSAGISHGPMQITGGEKPPVVDMHIEANVFWQVEQPACLRKSRTDRSLDEPLSVVGDEGNRVVDPKARVDEESKLVIDNEALARELQLSEVLGLTVQSPWPITPEELAMVPGDGTVEAAKWKKRPKLRDKQ